MSSLQFCFIHTLFEGGEVLWCVRDSWGEAAGVPFAPRIGSLIATALPQHYIRTGQQVTCEIT